MFFSGVCSYPLSEQNDVQKRPHELGLVRGGKNTIFIAQARNNHPFQASPHFVALVFASLEILKFLHRTAQLNLWVCLVNSSDRDASYLGPYQTSLQKLSIAFNVINIDLTIHTRCRTFSVCINMDGKVEQCRACWEIFSFCEFLIHNHTDRCHNCRKSPKQDMATRSCRSSLTYTSRESIRKDPPIFWKWLLEAQKHLLSCPMAALISRHFGISDEYVKQL